MAVYDSYEEPSLTHQMFGSPLRAQWTLQKASTLLTMNGSMFKRAMQGEGIRWSGVVGFRGLALGKGAAGNGIARALSPGRLVGGIAEGVTGSSNFTNFGLFGSSGFGPRVNPGGILNKTNGKASSVIGRIIGGGTFGKWDVKLTEKIEQDAEQFLKKSGTLRSIGRKLGFGSEARESAIKMMIRKESFKQVPFKSATVLNTVTKYGTPWGFAESVTPEMSAATEGARKQVVDSISKEFLAKKWVLRAAKVGRMANWAFAADVAFDVGSAIGTYAMGAISNTATTIENKLLDLTRRRTMFEGKVGIGFMSGGSGNERQRALTAIGRGSGGAVGMGNEAAYQHVDSTW